jgi:protein-S-isoprenylcysteine O-methyltransferase
LLLNNPICFVLWFYAGVSFFGDRIPHEEYYLVKFFGKKYTTYAEKTPILIPFVEGYV